MLSNASLLAAMWTAASPRGGAGGPALLATSDATFGQWVGANLNWLLPALLGAAIVSLGALLVRAWRVHRRLLASEERLRFLHESAADAAWEWNAVSNQEFYSPRWWRMLGYEPGELGGGLGLWKQLLHPDDAALALRTIQHAYEGRAESYEVEFRLRHKAGHYVPLLSRGFIIRDTSGRPVRVAGTNTDLTELRRIEQAVRESERHLAAAQAIAHVGSWTWDLRTNAVTWSDEHFAIFGHVPQAIVPSREVFGAALHPDDRARVLAAVQGAVKDRGMYSVDCRIVRPSGEVRHVQCRGTVRLGLDGQPATMAGTVQDLTERHRVEHEREELAAQLRQSQKLDTLGQLAGGIAHDFNNLLTAILGNASLLETGTPLSLAQRTQLAQIVQAGERAAELTHQLLLFSRRQTPARRDIDLNDTIVQTVKLLQRIIGENIELQLAYAPEPQYVSADSGMIGQVLLNLAVNARDAMPRGGRLAIRTETVTLTPASVTAADRNRPDRRVTRRRAEDHLLPPLASARAGTFACLTVADQGVGMTPEVLAHIFEPFFTTKEVGKGTGLGLATVYGIVQQHHGWIEVESEPGKGATFRVFLPRIEAVRSRSAQPFPLRASTSGRGQTVLVVEDDGLVSSLVQSVLAQAGYTVLTSVSGDAALQLWPRHRGGIDLLIADIVMPGATNGPALARQLLADQPQLRVIFISGYCASAEAEVEALDGSAIYLPKPFTPDSLLGAVRQQLAPPEPSVN